jgi:DNA end-binding protein Ku
MAPRAYWKGSLKLSLVSCPVALYPASTSVEKTRFHMINKETGNRLKQQMIDAETGDVVESDQKGRGYELKKGEYVEVEKEELEAVQIESNHTIDIDSFVPSDEIDKRYLDHPYYIVPDGKAGIDAFAVIRDAMKDKDRTALARIVLTSREHVIAIEPLGKGLLFRRHQEPEDFKGHGRTGQPYPRYQGRAFRPLEIQGRIRKRHEGAGAAQGLRQNDQGSGARGEARQCDQPDGCAEGEPEGRVRG